MFDCLIPSIKGHAIETGLECDACKIKAYQGGDMQMPVNIVKGKIIKR